MREFARRLGFPLALGMVLACVWLLIRPKAAPLPVQHVWDFGPCGLGKPIVRPMDLDGDPEHAVLSLVTHYECDQDIVNLWQTPRLR